jgi:hypothetical protein
MNRIETCFRWAAGIVIAGMMTGLLIRAVATLCAPPDTTYLAEEYKRPLPIGMVKTPQDYEEECEQ